MTMQNLRGFAETTIRLDGPVLFLVGPNNAGKTSLMRLLDVVFNWDLAREFKAVSDGFLKTMLPARETRNAARRITLRVRILDGRRHNSLQCDQEGVAQLRLSLTVNDKRLRANLGSPRRNEPHDSKAERFLKELRDQHAFVHIPAGRSVDSVDFDHTLLQAMTISLMASLQQPGRGATKAEREAKKVVEALEKLAIPVEQFWKGFLNRLPFGWVTGGTAIPQLDRMVLARIIVEQLAVRLTTGSHDSSGVSPVDVGSGLQSLLDFELRRYVSEVGGRQLFLAIEEPEVFLHPSAQRHLGRVLSSGNLAARTLVSTHSPLIVEEASFDQVAIIRDHVVSQPRLLDADRLAINNSLMSGRGAELQFARSVLLVEGPGDREYWEVLRRKMSRYDSSGAVDHCYVLDVGTNTRFAPWIRLLRSYSSTPFVWLAVLDSDSTKEARDAVDRAGLRFSERQQNELEQIRKALSAGDIDVADKAARRLAAITATEVPILLAPGDLEFIMCSRLSTDTCKVVCDQIGVSAVNATGLAERLGTKHRKEGKAIGGAKKAPWIRGLLARVTPTNELDPFVLTVLERWIGGATEPGVSGEIVKSFCAGKLP